jgi:hypothetical protein
MLLALRGGKLKCLIFPLLMERQLLGYPGTGRYGSLLLTKYQPRYVFQTRIFGSAMWTKHAGIDHFFQFDSIDSFYHNCPSKKTIYACYSNYHNLIWVRLLRNEDALPPFFFWQSVRYIKGQIWCRGESCLIESPGHGLK